MRSNPYTAPAADLVTTAQAAALLGVTPRRVAHLAEQGQLVAIRTGPRATVFDSADVRRLAAARNMAPPRPGPQPKSKEPTL